jgi:nicotinamide-nucleotide amidase
VASAEILSIGTELLLGQVLDTNSQFIATELAKLGIDSFFRTTVGDNVARIKEVFQTALRRADIVIATGGLGPTADDLTHECIAELFGVEMVFDEAVFERIKSLFASLKYKMPESNRKQAFRPAGAQILPNPAGTAPGIIWKIDKQECNRIRAKPPKTILTFPGVPRELKAMWHETAAPFLSQNYSEGVTWSRELKHYGIGESALAEKYAHLLALPSPTVAPYAGRWECRLRVTAKAPTVESAMALAKPVIDEIMRDSGTLCYGLDDETLESVVGDLLTKTGKSLAVAESCTGGLVSERLTDIPGSSNYIKLNVVSYANEAKQELLGVSEEVLAAHGAVSAESAEQMAKGIKKLAKSDLGLSVTGIAGPTGGTPEKPVGLVYLGLAANDFYTGKELRLPSRLSRADIRLRSANEALNMVRLFLLEWAVPSAETSR